MGRKCYRNSIHRQKRHSFHLVICGTFVDLALSPFLSLPINSCTVRHVMAKTYIWSLVASDLYWPTSTLTTFRTSCYKRAGMFWPLEYFDCYLGAGYVHDTTHVHISDNTTTPIISGQVLCASMIPFFNLSMKCKHHINSKLRGKYWYAQRSTSTCFSQFLSNFRRKNLAP